jgi:hypothetical protein
VPLSDWQEDRYYDNEYPQGEVPVMTKYKGRAARISIPAVDLKFLDKDVIPNISSNFMEFVNKLPA